MAESDLSSLPDIDSDPEIIGSETVTDGKSSTQLTLPDRLKSPTLSDLARKRKLASNPANPPKGMKRGKGALSHEPQSVTPSQRMREFPGKNVSVLSGKLFCTALFLNSSLIFGRAKRAPHWGVQSRFREIYICRYVCRGPKSVGGITWAKRAHAQSQYWAVKSDQ